MYQLALQESYSSYFINIYYILLINIRDKNKRTILGNIYLDNTYKINTIIAKANTISFI